PSARAATARGLPHPREARTAASGRWPSSRSLYSPGPKQALPPTPQAQDDPPQQSSSAPSAAMIASSAYLVRTASFVASVSSTVASLSFPLPCSALLAEHLDDQALAAPTVELTVEHLLPGTEVEPAVRHRDDHLMVDEQILQVRVAVVLPPGVVAIVARIGQQRLRHVVGRRLPAWRGHLVEPLQHVAVQARLVVVHPDPGGDVHRRDQNHAFEDAGLVDGPLDVRGAPHHLPAAGGPKRSVP